MALLLACCIMGIAWGTHICLIHFNSIVAPEKPVKLLHVVRLDPDHVACEILGVRLVFALPADWQVTRKPLNNIETFKVEPVWEIKI
ncbi:MAG: hypothetical protein H0Z39_04870 [Peptococcaceae bacterium]|nr:hypothetical protein [Peptococcaceae bacterium]